MKKKIVICLLTIMMTFLNACTNNDDIENQSHPSEKQQQLDSVQESQQPNKQETQSSESSHSEQQEFPVEVYKVVNHHETTADINGDGVEETVLVYDYRSDSFAYTKVLAQYEDGSNIEKYFWDYWYSSIVPGDLNGDGADEIVMHQASTANAYGFGNAVILHAENGLWQKYDSILIQNPLFEGCPSDFDEESLGNSPLGASIIEDDNGRKLLRLLFEEDLNRQMVKCIDCSYREDGWYIENVQIFSGFYGENNIFKLLNLDRSYNYIK